MIHVSARPPLLTRFPHPLHRSVEAWRQFWELRRWRREGSRPYRVPHVIKQQTVRGMALRHGLRTLVESGTFLGAMVYAMRHDFETIYSIELRPELYEAARRRFSDVPSVHLLQGDSGEVLATLVPTFTGPALFWLDGHFSGGATARGVAITPVLEEVRGILGSDQSRLLGHVILIDDAHLFVGVGGYPTLEQLRAHVARLAPAYDLQVVLGIISLRPRIAQ